MFTERTTIWAIVQGLCLLGALLTHYTAIVVLLSLGLYVLVRSLLDGMPRRVLFTIGACHLILAVVLCWLYFGHVRPSIPFGPSTSAIINMDYLRPYYYAKARETPLGFVWRSLSGTFSHAVGAGRFGLFLFMSAFLVGLAAILAGRTKAPRLMALLVISPFVVGFAAAIFRVFPFAGTRHQAYLLPFLAAGISAALALLPRGQAEALLLLGVTIAPVLVTRAAPDNNTRTMSRGDMTAAIGYVDRMVPQGSPLFVDEETYFVLRYYLARNDTSLDISRSEGGVGERFGGYRVVLVLPRKEVWAFRPDEMVEQVAESARALGVPPGDPLWVFSLAWFDPPLASRLPATGVRDAKEFGHISVISVLPQKL